MNQHPDDLAVDRFAAAMKEKLALARTKGRSGWEQCDPANLSAMLHEHVAKGDPRDVANFCMFLWNLGQPITPSKPIQAEPFMPVMQFRFEIARLTECLKRANSQAEHFEREWYLRGDEIEALKAERNKQAEPVGYIHKDDLKELLSDNAIGHHWLTVLFTLSDPDVVALYTHPAPAVAVNERLLCAAKKYFMSYCQDEASEFGPDDTGCSQEQHKDAVELGEAITAAEAAKGGE